MPFTPAHPALILPFINKKYFSATALIIGSTSPEFEYFFKASVSGVHGHTITGIFYFDIPVTLFFSFVFHLLIKENLIGNMPGFLQQRFQNVLHLDFKKYFLEHYGVVIFSALLGAASHVFWDSFTHNGAFFVRNLDIYKQLHIPFQGVNYPLFYGLQHISTWVGLTIIIVYVYLMPTNLSLPTFHPRFLYWMVLMVLGFTFFVLRFLLFPRDFDLGNAVVTGISSILLSLCILGGMKSFRPINHSR